MRNERDINSIAISGKGGTGKTTAAERLATLVNCMRPDLDWGEPFEAGKMFRRNRDMEENGDLAASAASYEEHETIDQLSVQQLRRGGISEGRAAAIVSNHYRLRNVTNVLLQADTPIRMERISNRDGVSMEEVREEDKREAVNEETFYELYGSYFTDPNEYDVVIDSGRLSLAETVGILGLVAGVITYYENVKDRFEECGLSELVSAEGDFSLEERFEMRPSGAYFLSQTIAESDDGVAWIAGAIVDTYGVLLINEDEINTVFTRRQ